MLTHCKCIHLHISILVISVYYAAWHWILLSNPLELYLYSVLLIFISYIVNRTLTVTEYSSHMIMLHINCLGQLHYQNLLPGLEDLILKQMYRILLCTKSWPWNRTSSIFAHEKIRYFYPVACWYSAKHALNLEYEFILLRATCSSNNQYSSRSLCS